MTEEKEQKIFKHDLIKTELEYVRRESGGLLRPEDVLSFAEKNPESALYSQFEWDDTEAAKGFRLAQARAVIRVAVIVDPASSDEKIRAYVSLSTDRATKSGYRAFVEVLDDEILRQQLLLDALTELKKFQNKYDKLRQLTELHPVFSAIDQVGHLKNGGEKAA